MEVVYMDKKTLEAVAKEVRLKYFREWRRKNKDKVKKHNKNYWEKKAKEKLLKEVQKNEM
jgi:hypothetical protein